MKTVVLPQDLSDALVEFAALVRQQTGGTLVFPNWKAELIHMHSGRVRCSTWKHLITPLRQIRNRFTGSAEEVAHYVESAGGQLVSMGQGEFSRLVATGGAK